MHRLLALLLFPAFLSGQEVMVSARAIREIPRERAALHLPVLIEGVVTFSVPGQIGGFVLEKEGTGIWVGLFSNDSTRGSAAWAEGILRAAGGGPTDLKRFSAELRTVFRQVRYGMKVEISGVTVPGGYAPAIAALRVRILAEDSQLPPAPPLDPVRFATGELDCQRVTVEGIVQRVDLSALESAGARLTLGLPGQPVDLSVWRGHQQISAQCLGARVRSEAVCGTHFNERGEALGVFLQSSATSQFSVLASAPGDPFDVPDIRNGQMLPFRPDGPLLTRQKLSGAVSFCRPGSFLIVEAEGRAIRVRTRDATHYQPGDVVEAAGFVEMRGSFAELTESVIRRTGATAPALPKNLALIEALAGANTSLPNNADDHQGSLVTMLGTLDHLESFSPSQQHLHCRDDTGRSFMAVLDAALSDLDHLQDGSDLQLTGICDLEYSQSRAVRSYITPTALQLLLRDVDDIRVRRSPPFWNSQRLYVLLGSITAILTASLIWAAQMRRLVKRRSAQLAHEIATREQAALSFQTLLTERKRMATDLHDGMEQTLNGLALQIEAAQKFLDQTPAHTARHLDLSLRLLDATREEMRRSVWDLRSEGLAGKTLPQALAEHAPAWLQGSEIQLSLETEGNETLPVPDSIAGNLLLLAREAVTNALKHASPSCITLKLSLGSHNVIMSIQDDGKGFDPEAAPGPSRGHFGLQGMKERMARLQGSFTLQSSAQGTHLSVTAPLIAAS
jgi:signal transduction histidine kinase